ncbi:flavin reductase [Streptomyces lavendulae]|uniref:flavin reductase n=1 Tax=Streptomyces lavendulae TaxID=1914 RepID=UPI003819939B
MAGALRNARGPFRSSEHRPAPRTRALTGRKTQGRRGGVGAWGRAHPAPAATTAGGYWCRRQSALRPRPAGPIAFTRAGARLGRRPRRAHGRGGAVTELDPFTDDLDGPVYVVTVAVGAERAGCLVGFASQCSIDRPRFIVWLSVANHTYRVARGAGYLTVHLLRRDDRALAELFGVGRLPGGGRKPGPGAAVPLVHRPDRRVHRGRRARGLPLGPRSGVPAGRGPAAPAAPVPGATEPGARPPGLRPRTRAADRSGLISRIHREPWAHLARPLRHVSSVPKR